MAPGDTGSVDEEKPRIEGREQQSEQAVYKPE